MEWRVIHASTTCNVIGNHSHHYIFHYYRFPITRQVVRAWKSGRMREDDSVLESVGSI